MGLDAGRGSTKPLPTGICISHGTDAAAAAPTCCVGGNQQLPMEETSSILPLCSNAQSRPRSQWPQRGRSRSGVSQTAVHWEQLTSRACFHLLSVTSNSEIASSGVFQLGAQPSLAAASTANHLLRR